MTGAFHDFGVLTRLRLRLLLRAGIRRYTRDARSAGPVRLIVGALVLLWLAGSVIVPLTHAMSAAYTGPDGLARFTSAAVLGISAVTLLVFFYAVLSLVTALTGGGDLRLLLLAPISPRMVVGFKIGAVALGFSPILLFGVPGLLAAGQALHFGPAYIGAVLLLVLIVPVAPTGLATLLVLAVLRWLPPARARSVATILGVVLGASMFVASQLLFGPGRGYSGSVPSVTLPAWIPSTWPGRGLVALGTGQAGTAALYLGGTVLLAVLLSSIAVELAARLLATGTASYAEVGRRRRSTQVPMVTAAAPRGRRSRRLPRLPRLHKDLLTFRRDPQRLAILIYPLLLVGFYLYRLLGQHTVFSSIGNTSSLFLSGALYAVLMFSIVILIGPTAATVINLEGRSLYLLALAPLPVRALLLAKWSFVAAPVVVVIEAILMAGAIVLQIDSGQALFAGIVLAAVTVALSGAALTINLIWPRFESDNPRRQGSGVAALVSYVADLGVGGVSCVLLIVSLAVWPTHHLIAALLALGIFLLAGGCTLLARLVGTRVLANLLTSDRRPR